MKYFVKILLLISCSYIVLLLYYLNSNKDFASAPLLLKTEESVDVKSVSDVKLKYILKWADNPTVYFRYFEEGQEGFKRRNCPFTNCFVTSDKNLLGNYTNFDVIVFAGPVLKQLKSLPKMRSAHQKYVFASIETGDYYPVCNEIFNDYFNWTWTYKLDSDIRWGYLTIRDKEKKIIGPNKDMNWIQFKDMEPVTVELKDKFKKKTKAAAWFVTNCNTKSKREDYVHKLQVELRNHNLSVDIYGHCGNLKCRNVNNMYEKNSCGNIIRDQYYFYLSFENSFAEDYVTEKLLTALLNNAVPVVYGAADYSRFLPEGSYLNAKELGVKNLATKMIELINNPESYIDYFRWQNHYSYEYIDETPDTNAYCGFCKILNNAELVNKKSSYKNFTKWFTPPGRC